MADRFIISDGVLQEWARAAEARYDEYMEKRSHLAAPSVIRDGLDGVLNPCDGKRYDSKGAYYRAVKDAGCVIVGNEAGKMMTREQERSDVKANEIVEAMQKVEAGYKPASLEHDE